MLKLEKKQGQVVQIRFKEERPFWKRALVRALVYSLLAHIVLISVIKIRLLNVHGETGSTIPIEVALDQDEEASSILPTKTVDAHDSFAMKELFLDCYEAPEEKMNLVGYDKMQLAFSLEPAIEKGQPYVFEIPASLEHEVLLASLPPLPKISSPPFKLHFSNELNRFTMISDGSSIFAEDKKFEKSNADDANTLIEFDIDFDRASGTITSWTMKETSGDSRLDGFASKILEEVRFLPQTVEDEYESIQGTCQIEFCAPYEDIQKLIKGR